MHPRSITSPFLKTTSPASLMTNSLVLRELTAADEAAFLNGYEDWKNEELSWYSFVWKPGMPMSEHLQKLTDNKDAHKIPIHFVPNTMLYAFVNHQIVGRLSVRHYLNDHLLARGGHVGYAVSPQHRQKGYATEILKQGLNFCRTLDLDKILVTCSDSNTASWKVIEKLSGHLENKISDPQKNELIRRYWINI
jgi:predicted acetyltransferase